MKTDPETPIDELDDRARAAKMRLFLESFATHGNRKHACEAAGMSRTAMYRWLDYSKEARPGYAIEGVPFHELFEAALEEAGDVLEAEVRRRAVDGWLEPVWFQGKQVGEQRKFSELLLIFLTKKANPAFRDNHRVDVAVQGRVEIDSARDRLAAKLETMLLEGARPEAIDVAPVRPALGEGDHD